MEPGSKPGPHSSLQGEHEACEPSRTRLRRVPVPPQGPRASSARAFPSRRQMALRAQAGLEAGDPRGGPAGRSRRDGLARGHSLPERRRQVGGEGASASHRPGPWHTPARGLQPGPLGEEDAATAPERTGLTQGPAAQPLLCYPGCFFLSPSMPTPAPAVTSHSQASPLRLCNAFLLECP